MNHHIYKIQNLINGRLYIGQTNSPTLRWQQHLSDAKLVPRLIVDKAIKKHGKDNFVFQIIEQCQSQAEANYQETWHIFVNRSLISESGYNVALGGQKLIHTLEIKEKISKRLKEHYQTHVHFMKGKKMPEEWKENISKASMGKAGTNTGKNFSLEWKQKISQAQAGVDRPDRRRFSLEEEQQICNWYQDDGWSTTKISKHLKCCSSLIKTILNRNQITLRFCKSAQNSKRKLSQEQESEIYNLHLTQQMTRSELAKKFECGKTTIREIIMRQQKLVKDVNEF